MGHQNFPYKKEAEVDYIYRGEAVKTTQSSKMKPQSKE